MSDGADKCKVCHHDWHGAALCGERVLVVVAQSFGSLVLPTEKRARDEYSAPACCARKGVK